MQFEINKNKDIVYVKKKTINNITKERREICTNDVVGAVFEVLADNDDYKRDGVSQSFISQKNENDRLQAYDFSHYVLIDRNVLAQLKENQNKEDTDKLKNQLKLSEQDNERCHKIISEYEKKLTDNGISTALESDKPMPNMMIPSEDVLTINVDKDPDSTMTEYKWNE